MRKITSCNDCISVCLRLVGLDFPDGRRGRGILPGGNWSIHSSHSSINPSYNQSINQSSAHIQALIHPTINQYSAHIQALIHPSIDQSINI